MNHGTYDRSTPLLLPPHGLLLSWKLNGLCAPSLHGRAETQAILPRYRHPGMEGSEARKTLSTTQAMTRRPKLPALLGLLAALRFSGAHASELTARSARPRSIAAGYQH